MCTSADTSFLGLENTLANKTFEKLHDRSNIISVKMLLTSNNK